MENPREVQRVGTMRPFFLLGVLAPIALWFILRPFLDPKKAGEVWAIVRSVGLSGHGVRVCIWYYRPSFPAGLMPLSVLLHPSANQTPS